MQSFAEHQTFSSMSHQLFDFLYPFPGSNKWAVFDIDETILAKTQQGRTIRIDEVFDFYSDIVKTGLKIAFVTARVHTLNNVIATMQQLSSLGFGTYSGLFMMPAEIIPSKASISIFKAMVRANLEGGVLINIGNNWSDLTEDTSRYLEFSNNAFYLLVEDNTVLLKLPMNPSVLPTQRKFS